MERERDASPPAKQESPTTLFFVPILLVVIALLLMTGFQTIQLTREHELLQSRLETQGGPLEESRNVRAQLQSVATATKKLAEGGNGNAARVIEQLERAGIKISLDESS